MNKELLTLNKVSKQYSSTTILHDINLTIYEGEFLTLLGPSGCGKTTILRLIGGFEAVSTGEIVLQGTNINTLSPEKRVTNTVFQSYALFPHMSVYDNVAFGLKMKKIAKTEITQEVEKALAMVKLSEHQYKKPHELSGGQQQRVAIARAVVNRPLILLLDEPLSALDYKLRKAMQIELKILQRQLGITFLFVTHDQEEALSMSDRIVVMNQGKIEQIGTPKAIYEEPKNRFVAQFIGEANCFDANCIEQKKDRVILQYQEQLFRLKSNKKITPHCTILIRPEDFRAERNIEDIKSNNYFVGILKELIYKGTTIELLVKLSDGKEVIASEFYNEDSDALEYQIGMTLYLYWVEGWEVLLNDE